MLWGIGLVVVLIAFVLIPNALYAIRQFLTNRNVAWLTSYVGLLCMLGYLLLHTTMRTAELVQTAKEIYQEPGP